MNVKPTGGADLKVQSRSVRNVARQPAKRTIAAPTVTFQSKTEPVYFHLLGREPKLLDLQAEVQAGLKWSVFTNFQQFLGVSARQAAILIQIPESSLARRKKQGRLGFAESERLLRFSRLYAATLELFGGASNDANEWMKSPKPALGGLSPLEMARTEVGAREVEADRTT